ncbi:MgtC/SapB family protein, partial [Salmonella enterica subsp. enterica]|nr:MgtC/SapB family protein [Salmonella enterica subsp. enterica]
SIMTLLVLEVLHQITSRFMNKTWHLQLTLADIETVSIIAWFKNHHIKSRIVSLQETATNDIMTVDITLTARTSIDDIMQELKNIPGVQSVSIS